MYNITTELEKTPISNITPTQILALSTEKNKKREMRSSCKKIYLLESGVSEQNILLKTIQDIDAMLVERNELEGYVFIKCIKALSLKQDGGYKITNYSDLQGQLINLGLEIIRELEPKLSYTTFNTTSLVKTDQDIKSLIAYISEKFYKGKSTIFETKKLDDPANKIPLKVYAQGKGSFTIKKFLENIFSLYEIIPPEK